MVDDFWRKLIRETIYSFYRKKPLQLLMFLWETEKYICWNELWISLRTNYFVSFVKKLVLNIKNIIQR